MKNSNYTMGNRTRELPACSPVPHTSAPPRGVEGYYFGNTFWMWVNFKVSVEEPEVTLNATVFILHVTPWCSFFLSFDASAPQWARASSFTTFLDHTQRQTTVGRAPLDK